MLHISTSSYRSFHLFPLCLHRPWVRLETLLWWPMFSPWHIYGAFWKMGGCQKITRTSLYVLMFFCTDSQFWGTPIWWNTHITPIPLILIWFPLVTAEKTIRFIHSTRYWERTMSYYSNSMGHDMGDHFWPPTNFSYHASREITRGPPANSTFPSTNKEQLRPQPWCELGLQPAGRGNAWLLSFLQVLLTHKKWQAIREANIQNKNRNTAWFLLLPRIHNPPTLS